MTVSTILSYTYIYYYLYLSVKQNKKYNVSVQIMHICVSDHFELHNTQDNTLVWLNY